MKRNESPINRETKTRPKEAVDYSFLVYGGFFMQIMRYELMEDRGGYILNIYLEPQMIEFAAELGEPSGRKTELQAHIRSIIKERFQNVPITIVKVLIGSFVVTTLYLGTPGNITSAQTPTQMQTAPKYDTYTVKAGDTLYKIARELNVAVADIKQANNLTTDLINVGQELRLPYYTYTVVSGDTLYSIAKRNNTSVSVIQSYNQLSTNVLSIGQKIKIPQPITSVAPSSVPEEPVVVNPTPSLENPVTITPEPTASPEQNVSTVAHLVAAGETLYAISRQYGTTVSAIKNANNLTSDILSIGQKLIIPTANETIQQPVDSTPPSAPIPTTAELITSESAASYPIRGTTEPGAVVEIFISDGIHPSITTKVVANGNGEFSTNVNVTSLQDGSLSMVMKASDDSGNESTTTKITVSKDTSVVQPALHIPTFVTSANAENFVISGTTEANATITLRITDTGNQAIEISIKADPNGHFETVLNLIGLKDGSLSLLATATDENGNKSEPKVATAQKDTSTVTPTIEDIQGITPDNVSQYPLVGHAEPGAIVEVVFSDDGNQEIVRGAKADSTGTFQVTADLRTLQDGAIQVTTRASDEVGNQSEPQQTIIEKRTIIAAPELTALDVINSKNAENYKIIGKAQPGAVVDVSLSDGVNPDQLLSTTANENGEFEVLVDVSMLIDTSIMVSAFQTISNGLTSEMFETMIIKDASNPNAPLLHNTNFINQENQASYHLQGKGEPNAELLIRMFHSNGQVLNFTGTVNENGEFDIPVDLATIDDGEVTFEIMQIDQAGNESERYAKTLVKDTIGPAELTPESMSSIYSGNVLSYMLSGKTEAHTKLEIQFTDGTNTVTKTVESNQEGKFEQSFDLGNLKDGRLIVTFRAIDNAGNVGTPKPVTIVKDTTAPAEVVTNLPDFINRSNQQPFTLKGSSIEEGAIVDILISDNERQIRRSVQVINGSFSDTVDLSVFKDGPLTFEFIQTDNAGNTGIVNSSTVIKDTVVENPGVAKSGFRYENLQHIFTLLGSAEPGGTIEVTLFDSANNKLVSKRTTVDEEGYYAVDLFSQDIQAVHSVTVELTDAAGNISGVTSATLNTYTVSAGDTLYSIAKRYNTTVDALIALNHLPTDALVVTQTLRLPLPASEVVNLGYLYFGSTKEYANVVNSTGHAVNIVSPSYFDINPDGTLKLTYQVDQNFIDTMHRQGVRVVPFLSNHWNREVGRAMLQNKELAARQLADAIERYNLDGVNVDIENVTAQDRENYTEFVRLLRQFIPNHKEVSVAVAANPNGWETGWHGSYDYTELANIADYLMIMAYDESYEGGEPGSVASHSWVEKSIQYAVSEE
jgi:spore germination protein YaaH